MWDWVCVCVCVCPTCAYPRCLWLVCRSVNVDSWIPLSMHACRCVFLLSRSLLIQGRDQPEGLRSAICFGNNGLLLKRETEPISPPWSLQPNRSCSVGWDFFLLCLCLPIASGDNQTFWGGGLVGVYFLSSPSPSERID